MPNTNSEAFALGSAYYEDVVTVRDFARERVRPVIDRFANPDNEDGTVHGLFLRNLGWLSTLSALRHPEHFQAALAGTRALLEISIDLALLHHDRANLSPTRMIAWERSAKLKAAERTRRCFEGRQLPAEHVERVAFIDREGAAIRSERHRLWRTRKHPDRWTGRGLDVDAKAADDFGSYGLRDYYDGRFAELCWGAHGSGLAGVRFVSAESFPGIIALAFLDGARLGTLACELALRYFDKFDAILQARFRQMERERLHWRAVGFGTATGEIPRQGP